MKLLAKKVFAGILILLTLIILIPFIYLQVSKPETIDSGFTTLHKTLIRTEPIRAVKFSSDSKILITAGVDSLVSIWDLASGSLLYTLKQPQGITYLDIHPDSPYVATSSYDGIARVWDLRSKKTVLSFPESEHSLWAIDFNYKGNLVAFAGEDRIIYVYEIPSGKSMQQLKGHLRNIWSVKFSPDDRLLASASFDNSVILWDPQTGSQLKTLAGHEQAVVDLEFSHDGKILATTSDDKTIKLWRVADGQLLKTLEAEEHVQAVCFSPDDKLLFTGGRDKTMFGELIQNFTRDSEKYKGISARIWDISSGKIIQTFTSHSNDVNDLAWSADGKWLATASEDKTIQVWHKIK